MQSIFEKRRFPVAAGVFFGLGLGGFFDGIVHAGGRMAAARRQAGNRASDAAGQQPRLTARLALQRLQPGFHGA